MRKKSARAKTDTVTFAGALGCELADQFVHAPRGIDDKVAVEVADGRVAAVDLPDVGADDAGDQFDQLLGPRLFPGTIAEAPAAATAAESTPTAAAAESATTAEATPAAASSAASAQAACGTSVPPIRCS